MRPMRRPLFLALVLGLAVLAVAVAPHEAAAHRGTTRVVEEAAPVLLAPALQDVGLAMERLAWSAAPMPASVPWPLVAAAVALAALGARRPRRALTLTLILLAAVYTFETGVHSVHHLADRDGEQHCAVAAASQHVTGTEVDGVTAAEVISNGQSLVSLGPTLDCARFTGPERGRAPPALLA
jgi:hypothetical protein